jgi:hypothetical protein
MRRDSPAQPERALSLRLVICYTNTASHQAAGANFLFTALTHFLGVTFTVPGFYLIGLAGELPLCLWLMVVGVNVPRWRARVAQP